MSLTIVKLILLIFVCSSGDHVDLKKKHCVPCEGGEPPLTKVEEDRYMKDIDGWDLDREGIHNLERKLKFKDFKKAMDFINEIAEIAESEGHHPDISISWNEVGLELTTHAINGLSENDFIMASKINEIVD